MFIFILNVCIVYGQKTYKIKIIDSKSGVELDNAHLLNKNNHNVFVSDQNGIFSINKTGIYIVSRLGYEEKQIEITNANYQIIELDIKPSELNEIVVRSNQIPSSLKKSVSTIDVISSKDIEKESTFNIAPILNKVPGVFMYSGSLNTNKIIIRGIGSRDLYGTSKIRAYFKDIPLTTGNGETTIEDFELNTVSRIEILKGASSSIFGAGLGGTIHLTPQNASLNETHIKSELLLGSFGLNKAAVNINYGNTNNSLRGVYSNTHSDGYRDNNNYNRQTLTLITNHFLNDKNELSILGSYVKLKSYIPSSIDENTFLNSPSSAAYTWKRAEGFEDYTRGIIGTSWSHNYTNNLKQITSFFTSFRKALEPRPFNILKENTIAFGIRSRILGKLNIRKHRINWTLGAELFNDNHHLKTFENLYLDFPIGSGSIEGEKLSSFNENRAYLNLFVQAESNLSKKMLVSFGINLNKTRYNLDDNFNKNTKLDQSGNYKFDGIISPKLGVSYVFSDKISVFSNISHGFSPPTIEETLLPEGTINTEIKPESGLTFEIGTRGNILKKQVTFNLSLYQMLIKNLLVARRTTEDQYIGINAGKTIHNGLEFSLIYNGYISQTFSINSNLSYSLNNFTFKEFIDSQNNYSGNKLTGVPSEVLNLGVSLDTKLGLYTTINYQHVGKIPINDSNTLFTDIYNLVNSKLGYKFTLAKGKLEFNSYLGINNIFDTKYASQLLINATGFGGQSPRYYYPGNPINFYTGITINYYF
ncbi:TonB-dependent receptor [Aureibaculum marinum]|uniref:TonB-dependent receptor n=1 Tax=Aureibaculum marinum TaxID=2487930 RepID=A0A3N4NV59_9FLAO|nr:TonB-dependent receptor [Aureibaculum marinum]RPE00253.1 TonB-dependent receptor [Aureibaculum marinum]